MLTEKDYCDYETSRELKELGFIAGLGEDDCGHCLYDDAWHDQVDRPLLYEAQKWLREEKGIIVELTFAYMDEKWDKYYSVQVVTDIRFDDENYTYECDTMILGEFKGYENALSEGIKIAVKILKGGVK